MRDIFNAIVAISWLFCICALISRPVTEICKDIATMIRKDDARIRQDRTKGRRDGQ